MTRDIPPQVTQTKMLHDGRGKPIGLVSIDTGELRTLACNRSHPPSVAHRRRRAAADRLGIPATSQVLAWERAFAASRTELGLVGPELSRGPRYRWGR